MKVLLVEDSLTVRTYIEGILRDAPDITLLPPARDGVTGVEFAQSLRPDVILMDLELPRMTGLDAIKEIMATAPRPIVVLSAALESEGTDRTFDSFQAGAVEVLAKPRGLSTEERERFSERLVSTIRLMSEARVLRRKPSGTKSSYRLASAPPMDPPQPATYDRFDIVLIGASTGGPQVVRAMLDELLAPYPLPIVLCQHIVPGFEEGMAHWLSESGHRVHVVRAEEHAKPGQVYVARADKHLAMNGLELTIRPPTGRQVLPSADVLFDSAAVTLGNRCIALLLTGMGEDGRHGLLALKERGSLTITQSAATCVIDGMPAAARQAGASVLDLSPPRIVELLKQIAQIKKAS
jgi:two-component system, chemotaxis family, protein-glutamate methylesterase/glutaminase